MYEDAGCIVNVAHHQPFVQSHHKPGGNSWEKGRVVFETQVLDRVGDSTVFKKNKTLAILASEK